MNEKFELALLHRHYNISPNEKVVELGPVSSPWDVADRGEEIPGGSVLPRSWRVYDGELKPLEFKFIPKRDMATQQQTTFPKAFVKELIQLLFEAGLDDILGIQLIDKEREKSEVELMEVTYGRSSLMIPAVPREDLLTEAFAASWCFVPTQADVHTRHGICAVAPNEEGVVTKHGICAVAPNEEGVVIKHGICAVAPNEEDVVTKHGN